MTPTAHEPHPFESRSPTYPTSCVRCGMTREGGNHTESPINPAGPMILEPLLEEIAERAQDVVSVPDEQLIKQLVLSHAGRMTAPEVGEESALLSIATIALRRLIDIRQEATG